MVERGIRVNRGQKKEGVDLAWIERMYFWTFPPLIVNLCIRTLASFEAARLPEVPWLEESGILVFDRCLAAEHCHHTM